MSDQEPLPNHLIKQQQEVDSLCVSYKERTNTTMVTKDWSSKIGLSRFPNNAHEPLLLIKGDISQEKPMTFKNNLHVAIISIFD